MLKRSTLLEVSLAGILSAALATTSCQSGGTNKDDEGGDGGGEGGGSAGEGGGAGESGSKGGGNTAKGGGSKGGGGEAPAGGENGNAGETGNTGGTGGSSGGSGGSKTGGTGGMTMTGGTSGNGSMCTPANMYDGKPDAEIPQDLVFCEPKCIYRPNWPGHHTCGPAGSVYKPVAMKSDGVCGQMYNQDGIFRIPRAKIEPAAVSEPKANGGTVNNPVAGVSRAYLPGGMTGYNNAAAGKVAVSIWTSSFAGQQDTHRIEEIHEYLVKRGDIPYTIAIFMGGDMGGPARIKQLKDSIFPALKARWSKISDDPNYRVIAGQSTAAADSFDTVWLGTDVIAKAIGGSSSVVCFTCMGGQGSCAGDCENKNDTYMKEVQFCPARPIRFSSTVGTCDIMGSLGERLAAGCSGGTGAGDVDASQCGANWLKANQDLTNALKAKGMPHQLFIIEGGEHKPADWSFALPWQLRWAFKDITCAQ